MRSPPNQQTVRLLKIYIPVAIICVTVTVVIALIVTSLTASAYKAQMTLAVGTADAVVSADLGNDAQPITNTVSQLLRTNVVAASVIDRLKLRESPEEFLKALTVQQKPDAAALDISFVAPNKKEAVDVLNELSDVYQKQVKSITSKTLGAAATTAATGQDPSVRDVRIAVRVFDPPHAMEAKVAPRPLRNVGVAMVLGLLIAAFWVAINDAASTRRAEAAAARAAARDGAELASSPGMDDDRPEFGEPREPGDEPPRITRQRAR
jgi:capsular polysaccharide biosynthesis protein